MSEPPVATRRSRSGWAPVAAHPVISSAIAVLIVASIFFSLYVPIYARTTPKIGDFPFFYFYLLVYVPVVSIALLIVVQLQKRLQLPGDGDGTQAADVSEVAK
ncbi:MAG: DUF3311 domain-containing protein [Actinomycetota bacterium]|nr:DUF3311 domain-containing protein [Actinomycetota bacterium]